ncbi:dehydrogenase [bacterium]|nr:dehydrogenase [bacterium]
MGLTIRSKAPLRLGLAGGGTDVSPYSDEYGGTVLNATIDLYAFCIIEATDNRAISIVAADSGQKFQGPAASHLEIDDSLALQKGVYNRIVSMYTGGEPLSFKMTTYTDASAGSGLGSSSTLVVAIIKAFVEWLNLPLGEYDIASLAYEIERSDLGFSGGKQDQYAATFGGFNFMEFYADRVIVNPLRIKNWIINELESSMILYFTGASRESAQIIDEQTSNVQNQNQKSIEAMHKLKADSLALKEALLKGDTRGFAKIIDNSWNAKKEMAESITNPRIDLIYEEALKAGVIGGKITGAGGGGFMMLFADPAKKPSILKRLEDLPGKVFNFHFNKQGTVGWKVR